MRPPEVIHLPLTIAGWAAGKITSQPRRGRFITDRCYNFAPRRRKALVMTETELKLMAALASMGLSSQ
jgi:hypothetical protein